MKVKKYKMKVPSKSPHRPNCPRDKDQTVNVETCLRMRKFIISSNSHIRFAKLSGMALPHFRHRFWDLRKVKAACWSSPGQDRTKIGLTNDVGRSRAQGVTQFHWTMLGLEASNNSLDRPLQVWRLWLLLLIFPSRAPNGLCRFYGSRCKKPWTLELN